MTYLESRWLCLGLTAGLAAAMASGPLAAAADDALVVSVVGGDHCVLPAQPVNVMLSMTEFSVPIAGYQAFLAFDPAVLTFVSAEYSPDPFGLPVIFPVTATPQGGIDVAAGVFTLIGQQPTTGPADLVLFHFMSAAEGQTQVRFRPHEPPTRMADADGRSIFPSLVNSPTIVVTLSTDDADGDSIPDPCDACPCFDDALDGNANGIPDGCDTYGDFDHDGDVDESDFAHVSACFGGPGGVLSAGCSDVDADGDDDADLRDIAEFQNVYGYSVCP